MFSCTRLSCLRARVCPIQSGRPRRPTRPGVEISYPAELNRWLPLVKWRLVIPHFIALFFVGIGAFFVGVYAFLNCRARELRSGPSRCLCSAARRRPHGDRG